MFNKFKKNLYSENGEDGIIQEILRRINFEQNGWCCEFGAWDGKVGSNTFNLVKNFNFKAIDRLQVFKVSSPKRPSYLTYFERFN